MRQEKEYLVEETSRHISDSDYVFLADYTRITVAETAEIRQQLAKHGAQFHVVKNRLLAIAGKKQGLPAFASLLKGPTVVIAGGTAPSEVAKILLQFNKEKGKLQVKGGILSGATISPETVETLSKLPSFEALRAQFLSLLQTPATSLLRVAIAAPQGLLNVLTAKSEQAA